MKTLKKNLIFATLLLLLGFFFIFYTKASECVHIIKSKTESSDLLKPYFGKRAVIYLIQAANKTCKPLYKYDELKALKKETTVVFLVAEDFTDIDIDNFRFVFKVPVKHEVKKIYGQWKTILKKCSNENEIISNIVMIIKKDGSIAKIRKF